jgi:hypothetical protein
MTMNRRNLLQCAGAAGALSILTRARSSATASPDRLGITRAAGDGRRLLLVCAQGGWDTTYALDPKLPSAVCDVPAGAAQNFGSLDVFTDASRPNVTAFFTRYAPITAIVRGISVASVAHRECLKRMATGTRSETNADMGALIAHDLGNGLPLPYLILGDTAFTGPYAVSAGRVGATNQIIALLDPAQAYPSNGRPQFATTDAEDAILARYASASVDRPLRHPRRRAQVPGPDRRARDRRDADHAAGGRPERRGARAARRVDRLRGKVGDPPTKGGGACKRTWDRGRKSA